MRVHLIPVYLLASDASKVRGVVDASDLPPGGGVLLPGVSAVTMTHTRVPLDVAFVDPNGRVLAMAERMRPGAVEPMTSTIPAFGALEVAGGALDRRGVQLGDVIRVQVLGVG